MASNNIQEELEVLKGDISQIRSDIQDLIGHLKDLGTRKINETRDSLEDELDDRRERLRATFDRAKAQGKCSVENAESQIAEHPIGSMLTAFGIGYILARLSRDK